MRLALGVILGYIVMAAFLFVTFSIVYLILGAEGSFKPGSFEISGAWIVASILVGFAGAILGGLTSRAVGKHRKAAPILAVLVLVLGVAMAIPTLSATYDESAVRTGDVAMMDAMQTARTPSWLAFLNPIIGAVGVILGSRCCKKTPA